MNKCVDPSEEFGKGCIASDGVRCTKCTSQDCCGDHEYYDFDNVICRPCSDYGEECEKCNWNQCTQCGGIQKENGLTIDWDGNCVACSDMFGNGCESCSETDCKSVQEGFVQLGSHSLKCSSLFGACETCNRNKCTKCDANHHVINGYCRQCSDIFGKLCSNCNEESCIQCVDEGILVNGVCVDDCQIAYGRGCRACDQTSCLKVDRGYFIAFGYSVSCNVLPSHVNKTCWDSNQQQSVRDAWNTINVKHHPINKNIILK